MKKRTLAFKLIAGGDHCSFDSTSGGRNIFFDESVECARDCGKRSRSEGRR